MNSHALEVLDFARALDLVAERAASVPGRAALRALRPRPRVDEVEAELDRVRQTLEFIDVRPQWAPLAFDDLSGPIARLATPGTVVDAAELHRLGRVLAASRALADDFDAVPELPPALDALRARLLVEADLERRIERTVDSDGQVLDTASRELTRIRARLRSAHQRIVRMLDRFMADLPDRYRVADASVSVREGRYVIPLRREGRGDVGGVVHDESGTGATLFVEPPMAMASMNELRDLEREEYREIERILRELSTELHGHAGALQQTHATLIDVDTLHARARRALEWGAHVPEVHAADDRQRTLVLRHARHPLLLARPDIERVVPYDLDLGPDERTMVVSGPNTGGKSVFLKALGLLSLLAQSGVVPPVGRGTCLPVFDEIFADIGDEQSIAESLSTFSAHLENLREIMQRATGRSLVLIDEMGTGTDPTEGAALARAILEALTRRGARTIATSHLGALKTLDGEGTGIVNASLEFNAERLEPTYQLTKGRPGRSYGLAIARRLGFDAELLERAQGFVDQGAASLEDLLERLEQQEREARERSQRTRELEREVTLLKAELDAREQQVRQRERSAEQRARDQARQLLMNAREQVEAAIQEVRESTAETLDEAARAARRRVEEAADYQRRRRPGRQAGAGAGATDRTAGANRAASLAVGQRVRLPGASGSEGELVELREGRATVRVGGLKVEVATADLTGLSTPTGKGRTLAAGRAAGRGAELRERGWSGPMPEARHEIDLRGRRVDEVELELGRALDAAIIADLPEVRIIHGKGTGAVMSRVREVLAGDARVREFRLGERGEGGSGVTVARLEDGA